MHWGIAATLPLQATRMVVDIRRKQPIIYGLTHAPASFIVCLIMINGNQIFSRNGSMERSNLPAQHRRRQRRSIKHVSYVSHRQMR